jgi:HSP20 family protein
MVATMLRTPASWFADLDRLQRELDRGLAGFGLPVSIRAASGASFPAVNIGSTPQAVEVYAFAPGVDPAQLEVTVDHNLLTIAGKRELPAQGKEQTSYTEERFGGAFRRVISLPDDIDASQVEARYVDGVLRVRIARREAVQPRRITVN